MRPSVARAADTAKRGDLWLSPQGWQAGGAQFLDPLSSGQSRICRKTVAVCWMSLVLVSFWDLPYQVVVHSPAPLHATKTHTPGILSPSDIIKSYPVHLDPLGQRLVSFLVFRSCHTQMVAARAPFLPKKQRNSAFTCYHLTVILGAPRNTPKWSCFPEAQCSVQRSTGS